jgi:hypothetical protein
MSIHGQKARKQSIQTGEFHETRVFACRKLDRRHLKLGVTAILRTVCFHSQIEETATEGLRCMFYKHKASEGHHHAVGNGDFSHGRLNYWTRAYVLPPVILADFYELRAVLLIVCYVLRRCQRVSRLCKASQSCIVCRQPSAVQ